jgi:uncharacterized protein YifE (UPF0438 family)
VHGEAPDAASFATTEPFNEDENRFVAISDGERVGRRSRQRPDARSAGNAHTARRR